MNTLLLSALTTLLAADLATPWEAAYDGEEATGPQVLGLWKFDADDGSEATGQLPAGTLKAGKIVSDGRFGGALESFSGYPDADESHGFVVPNHSRLNPSVAFTIEFWMKPKAEFHQRANSIAIDKKYAGHDGYQLSFGGTTDAEKKPVTLLLGYGSDSQYFVSPAVPFTTNEWVHVAVTYDGDGRAQFFRNGESIGIIRQPGRGPIAASTLPLSIGDRLGSNYSGCPIFLDEVRLTSGVREFGPLRIAASIPRRTFVRNEPAPTWTATVTNLRNEPLNDIEVVAAVNGVSLASETVPSLAVGASHDVEMMFDTTLRPDTYDVQVTATWPGQTPRSVTESFAVTIVPRPLPHRMPVVMWGIGGIDGVVDELPRLKKIGFTHFLGGDANYKELVDADSPQLLIAESRLPAANAMMDKVLAAGLRIMGTTWPGYYEPYLEEYLQTGRDGKAYERISLDPNAPKLQQLFERTGASWAKTYDRHPAFDGLLVNSEVRDASQVSFTSWSEDAHREEFGSDIPDWVTSKYGPSFSTLPDFPADRVVPDDEPHLAFYRWWWAQGDGWNAAHTVVHRGLQTSDRNDLWTFTDPVVRVPPLWGSGGDVDVLSHWSYTDPDPLRIAIASDELQAMAGGRQPKARTMKMTQLFWYRSSAAPPGDSPRDGKPPAEWIDQDPDAAYFSIHPMHLREAFWTKIARPIEGIMYHGWSSLVPTDGSHAYKYTHPDLQHELTRLVHNVVEPLGPMLQQIPDEPTDVAFLQSFTSTVFANRGTWGYAGSWQADAYLATLYARLQPKILYEQHILRDGLDGYRLLVMTDCDVLPQSVVDRVLEFQQAGGLIVGDERLCPAVKADVTIPVTLRKKDAAADKAALLEIAEGLRAQLQGKYDFPVDTDDPNMIPHRRRAGKAEYVFLVNDAREAGNYVGQYGRVLEIGLPTTADVRIETTAQAVYDLLSHREVSHSRDGNEIVIPLTLGPCDGRLLMAVPRPIASVAISGPDAANLGGNWSGKIVVLDPDGQPVEAVVPLRVDVLDPNGRPAEFSGYYGAAGGTLELTLDLASNDQPGVWEIRVHDLASGQMSSRFFRVGS